MTVAATALTTFALTQRSYQGHRWWGAALWLNTAAAWAAVWAPVQFSGPLVQWLWVPWPLLCLLGLRSFHARSKLLGSPRGDLGVLLALGLAVGVSLQNGVDAAHEAQLALLAGSAALLYAATILGLAPVRQAATELRVLALAWSVMAAPPLLGALLAWKEWDAAQTAGVHAGIVALGSLVTAFVLLAASSRRTERELRESRRRLRLLANIDMLTQVPNRRRFEELARRALQADPPGSAALLLVDIDHFKQINDKLGHAAGDRALKLVSSCTLELLRAQDVAGRHGGDEFVLLLRRSSTQDAMQVAERLVSHLQAQAHGHALPRLSLSFGIVQMRSDESIDDTLHRADLALYEAKRLGRSRAVASDSEDDDENPVFRSSQRLGLTS